MDMANAKWIMEPSGGNPDGGHKADQTMSGRNSPFPNFYILVKWWCREQGIAIQLIQPGRPMQNGFIERINGSYRKEILDAYVFFELNEAFGRRTSC